MTQPTVEGFFDNAIRTPSASAKFDNIGDTVSGVIVDQFLMDATEFGKPDIKKTDRNGNVIQQLCVILETNLRGWQLGTAPYVDGNDKSKGRKDPSQDNGNRTIFIEPFTNLHAAVGQATAEANGGVPTGLLNGSQFGVRFVEEEDRGKGNPLKKFQAFYRPAAASQEFFQQPAQAPAQQAPAPAPQQQAAPPAQPQADPWATQQAPAQPQQGFAYGNPAQAQPPAPAQDPWATPGNTTQQDEPPF